MAERSFYPGTQDISHLLAGTFEDLFTGDVAGVDMETNWIESRGGDDVYHETFTAELQKLLNEYKCRLTEADIVEENIIQAQDQAKAEEERAVNMLKADAGEDFHKMGLPPVASSFRWIVDNELLRKNHLTCPDDYITDKLPVTRAPKGKSEPGYIKETFSFKQNVSSGSRDHMPAKIAHLQKISGSLPNVSLCTLTLPSTPDSNHQTKKTSKKTNASEKLAWKDNKCKAEGESECAYLAKLEKRQNYLKNPRFFLPNTLHGGKSLVISQEKVEQATARRKAEDNKGDTSFVPVFLANPPTVLFSDYEVGQVYEMTIELQNITSTGHHVRLIPPSTSAFAIGPGVGQLIALELLFVTGGESKPEPGEVTDVTAQHLIRFDPQNPHTTEEKKLVIRNSSLVKERMLQKIPEYKAEDVIALEIEVKGSTEPFQLLLEPYAIIIPGENFIGVNVRKTFKMWNNSKSLIKYTWEKIITCDVMEVEPHTGVIDMSECCEFELTITGSKPGCISRNLHCKIKHCPEPVVLHVEAAFKLIGSQAAFCSTAVSPASGTLGPNEEKEFCIELSANIMGELKDLALCCSIEDMIEPLLLSISGEVKGLHVTYSVPCDSGVAREHGKLPLSLVTKVWDLYSPSHVYIRLDWEIYNREKDDKKLVDLLMLFGDPFPPKVMDENETASIGSNSESEIMLKLDQTAVPCGSIYPALQTTDEVSC
ncbi:deleted in lung and esophageal cancer protein 1 [Grus japonensis]|uniref:Deleted in lung and esophageal cancer protein 1 n=1 Tax=Grus japonensis TaxID=30415 RepID=A0ABC9WK41_GRUJA